MKKYILGLLFYFAVTAAVFAQSKNVRKAQTALDKGDFAEAKSLIDPATTDEKTKDEGKTWFLYGEVYQAIATDSTKSVTDVEDPFGKALQGYEKTKQLEKEGSTYFTMADQKIQQVWANAINQGATFYQNKDYANAMELFDVAKLASPKDTTAYIYAGISAQQNGNMEEAAENYAHLIDSLDYKSEDFYNSLIYIYSTDDTKDDQKALEYLEKAQQAFPENGDFLKREITLLINEKKYDEAEKNLSKAIEQEPKNAMLYYNRGYLYEQMDKGDQAIESYKKAIEMDPNYYDATFNLGAYYYNQAAEILQQANNMDLKEYQKSGKQVEDKAKSFFEKALPYLEKSRELKPDDEKVLTTLQTVYTRLGMDEKAQEVQSKLNGK